MSQEFEYKSLTEPDSIRLIELKPSLDHSAQVLCSLIYTTLSSDNLRDVFSHYIALSYVWGSPQNLETIWIDERPFKITTSLFSALRDLRDNTRPFFLWADGICISQSDDTEKSMQVQLMGRIYAEASNTIIYLGPGDPDSKECRCILSIRQGQEPADLDALSSIFKNSWFTRVWVFQELVFSSNPWVQCGMARAKWATMYNALEKGVRFAPAAPGRSFLKCSKLGKAIKLRTRKPQCFSWYEQGGASVYLTREIWCLLMLDSLQMESMRTLRLIIPRLAHRSLPILQNTLQRLMDSLPC
jgi:hypothetical protein